MRYSANKEVFFKKRINLLWPLKWGGLGHQNQFFYISQWYMSRDMRFQTMWYVRPAKPQISLCICSLIKAFASRLNIVWLLGYWLNSIWSFYALKEASQAHLSLYLSKCHIIGNHMSWLNYMCKFGSNSFVHLEDVVTTRYIVPLTSCDLKMRSRSPNSKQ